MTDFEQNDGLDGLTSEELEERAFGPDPARKRSWKRRPRKGKTRSSKPKAPKSKAPTPKPAPPAVVVTKFCYACGAEVDARVEFCPHCGVRQPEVPAAGRGARRRGKHKGTATLLALGLGGVGAHRFYLGQTKTGLAMLLFCWTLLPALLGVVDFVRYVLMSDARFAQLYDRPPPARALPAGRTGVLGPARRKGEADALATREPEPDAPRAPER